MSGITLYHVEVILKNGSIERNPGVDGWGYGSKEEAQSVVDTQNKRPDVALARVQTETCMA